MNALRVSITAGKSRPLITLCGEADLTNAAQLRDVITTALAGGAVYLTIDAAGLSFADSEVVGVFAATGKTLRELGGELILLRPQSHLIRVIMILGVDRVLTIRPAPGTVPEAHRRTGESTWPA